MRIAGWHIDGFGIFHELEVSLSGGITVFLGPNEAGKSTLFGFLRAMLFGFPSRRSRAAQYPPLQGGRHGGRLILRGPQGEVIVERGGSRKSGVRLNGREGTQEELRELLGGADESVFYSVFAFSLAEMQSFEWLRADQIRERIFSAGIAGAGASARNVMEALEKEAVSILRPRGACRVRDLDERIAQAGLRLKAAQADAERYVSLAREQESWDKRSALFSAEELRLRGRQRELEERLAVWSSVQQAREDLAGLATIEAFPSTPEARLAALAERVEAARILVRRCEEEQSAKQQMRAQLQVDAGAQTFWEHAEEFGGRLALHRDRLETLAGLLQTKRRDVLGRALGVCIAFLAGWLAGRAELAAGVALLFLDLLTAGFLLYQRNSGAALLRREIDSWERPVRRWLGARSSGEELISEFITSRERWQRHSEVRARAARLDDALSESQARLASARSELASVERALQEFLRECGAASEADFHHRLAVFRKREQISKTIEEQEARIGEPSSDAREWGAELAALRQRLKEVQEQRDEAVGEQRLADAERRRIAESAAIPTVTGELECLQSELAAAVREWRIATLAKELVARTLREFIRTRQPAVLEDASQAFARVTGGAYERIVQSEDSESLVVLDRHSQYKRPEELSRGAVDQLYLCLRLGLASEFARRSVALPLIMDDVLVNFDPVRARAMAEELARFSKQHQILIFTCHPATAQLFAETGAESKIIRMNRQGASAAEN